MKHFGKILIIATIVISITGVVGCASYYQKNVVFQQAIAANDYVKAESSLDKKSKEPKNRNYLLYLLNMGWLKWASNQPDESNDYFAKADDYMDVFKQSATAQALAFVVNPTFKKYEAEDHEKVLLNYYKALNYIYLNDYDGALVEARKINEKLYALNDKYKEKKNRYSDDAFAHVIMGLVYEANKDYNNAFIAYKNALKVYEEVYVPNFQQSAPLQLKKDLLRTASKMGFYSDVEYYQQHLNMAYRPDEMNENEGEVVFIWHAGLCPIKAQQSFDFIQGPNKNGIVQFYCEALNLYIPVAFSGYSSSDQAKFSNIRVIRMALPKYVDRIPVYIQGVIAADNKSFALEPVENVSQIATKTLQDRLGRELGTAILRLVVKQASEAAVRNQNGDLGAALSIANAISEQADTRNWQTLPNQILYTRIKLPEGTYQLDFTVMGDKGIKQTHKVPVTVRKGRMVFKTFNTTDTK